METLIQDRNGYTISLNGQKVMVEKGVEFFETANARIWIINPLNLTFDLDKLQKIDNQTHHSWEIPGSWSALVQNKNNNCIKAISSINGEYSWFYAPQFPKILSTNIQEVSRNTGLKEPDPVSVASYVVLSWTVGGYSFFKGVQKSKGGSVVETDGRKIVEVEADLKQWLGFDNSVSDTEILVKTLTEICKEALQSPKAHVQLTSGKDSRTILAAAMLSGLPFATLTGVSPSVNPIDIKLAKIISEKLSIPHVLVDASETPVPLPERIYREFTENFNAEGDLLNAIIHYKELVFSPPELTKIFGWGGEMFWGLSSNYVKILYVKLMGFKGPIIEAVKQRINSAEQVLREFTEEDIVPLFHLREKGLHWISTTHRSFLNYCPSYGPFLDPRILALGFRFKGGIGKSNLHQFLQSMFPRSVKRIPLNGGKLRIKYGKIKRWLFPAVNFSLLASSDLISSISEMPLFNEIFGEEKVQIMLHSYRKKKGRYAGMLHRMLGIKYLFEAVGSQQRIPQHEEIELREPNFLYP